MRALALAAVAALAGCFDLDSLLHEYQPPDAATNFDLAQRTLTVTPTTATLEKLGKQQFTASEPAAWAVVEMGGGAVDAKGLYTAPAENGVYHLVATALDDPALTATATVTVISPLALLSGQYGGSGYSNRAGADARLHYAGGLYLDRAAGKLYIADASNFAIRLYDTTTGALSLFAGQPASQGLTDGIGPAARFLAPYGLAYDGTGALYVADDNVIRKVDLATAAVSTIAGVATPPPMVTWRDGAANAAYFGTVLGLTYRPAGQNGVLDLADTENHCIREIDLAAQTVSTPFGLHGMAGVADGAGTAVKLDAGMPVFAQFHSPYDVLFDGANGLYVADTGNLEIRFVDLATLDVTHVATGLSFPQALRKSDAGALYFSDGTLLRYLDVNGMPQTVAGAHVLAEADGKGAAARFAGIDGIVFDAAGNLFATDVELAGEGTLLRKIAPDTTVTTVAGRAWHGGSVSGEGLNVAEFRGPFGMVYDGAKYLYITDHDNDQIRFVDAQSGLTFTLAGTAFTKGANDSPGALFNLPSGIAYDGDRYLFVADTGNNTIRQIDTQGAVVTTLCGVAGAGGVDVATPVPCASALFNTPIGVAYAAGALYVTDGKNQVVRMIDLGAKTVSVLAGKMGTAGSTDGTGASALFDVPYGIAVDAAGQLFVTDRFNYTLRLVTRNGNVTTLAGHPGAPGTADGSSAAARFRAPGMLAVAADDSVLYLADLDTVRKIVLPISPATVTTPIGVAGVAGVFPGALPAGLNRPSGVVLDGATGDLFVADYAENAILVVRAK